jgi:hypothetical protein
MARKNRIAEATAIPLAPPVTIAPTPSRRNIAWRSGES